VAAGKPRPSRPSGMMSLACRSRWPRRAGLGALRNRVENAEAGESLDRGVVPACGVILVAGVDTKRPDRGCDCGLWRKPSGDGLSIMS